MNKLSEHVKVAEAAEILGVSQGTVRSWAEHGKIPMSRNPANGSRLFRREDLEKLLKFSGQTGGEIVIEGVTASGPLRSPPVRRDFQIAGSY